MSRPCVSAGTSPTSASSRARCRTRWASTVLADLASSRWNSSPSSAAVSVTCALACRPHSGPPPYFSPSRTCERTRVVVGGRRVELEAVPDDLAPAHRTPPGPVRAGASRCSTTGRRRRTRYQYACVLGTAAAAALFPVRPTPQRSPRSPGEIPGLRGGAGQPRLCVAGVGEPREFRECAASGLVGGLLDQVGDWGGFRDHHQVRGALRP